MITPTGGRTLDPQNAQAVQAPVQTLNDVIDETRRRHRRRTDPVADAGADIAGPGAPEHDVIENDATRRLSALVDRLPPDQADVIRLRVLAGLDTEVVSEILGKSAGAIRVIQHRALRRLAELVGAPAEKKA